MSSALSPATTPPPYPPGKSTTTSPPPITPHSSPLPPSTNWTHPPRSSPSPPSVPPPSPTDRSTPPGSSPPTPEPSPPAPPPPPPYPRTPYSPSPPYFSSDPPSPSSDVIATGVVVGLAIVGVSLLGIIVICLVRKKKRRRDYEAAYYTPPPPPPPSGPRAGAPYGGQQQHRRQQQHRWQQPPSDHVVASLPPPPKPPSPPTPPPPPKPPSLPPPPPPPPFMSRRSSYEYLDLPILPPPSPGLVFKSTFTYEELAIATNGFSESNLLGQGWFGYVHKGVLPSGKVVAVKQLNVGSGQGDREFHAEVEIISRVHHKHLVSLVGYCMAGAKRFLVYDYVPNNNLEFHLHGKGRPTMEWSTRLKIAIGSAKGLSYLHEDCNPKITHRDIKAANILVDFNLEAKVADFGLAKIDSDTNTHAMGLGTFGYLADEYADKSDVFSFGVVLLELITGRQPVDANNAYVDESLVDWARPLLKRASEQGEFEGLADRKMNNEYGREEMSRMVACASACVRHSARRRPRMSQIVRALEGNVSLSDLNEGIRPGDSNVNSSYGGSTDYDDMNKVRKMGLGTPEYNSTGEYSNSTSDYGLCPSGSSSEGETTHEMEMGKIKRTGRNSGPSFKP